MLQLTSGVVYLTALLVAGQENAINLFGQYWFVNWTAWHVSFRRLIQIIQLIEGQAPTNAWIFDSLFGLGRCSVIRGRRIESSVCMDETLQVITWSLV